MKLLDRFIEKCIPVTESGCWIWMACIHSSTGYGRFGIGRRETEYAHRASWRLFKGEIPAGLDVCHMCDVRLCVNPNHLFLGTRQDNMKDASKKGRVRLPTIDQMLRAEKQPMAKLTNEQVREIRLSGKSQNELAAQFGVSQSCISLVKSRKAFKSVE
ncbi:MAG: HNH endonuclease [Zoogloeaceae bacterium]|nr:HNH endonuclease [Zoogloeaceae bacterium]